MKLRLWPFTKAAAPASAAMPLASSRGWMPVIREAFAGAWQRNIEYRARDVLGSPTVYACVTQIANDIGKLRYRLVVSDSDGIWSEASNPAYSPVLRKPNDFQNHIQFKQWWVTSKLTNGNAYVLKERDRRGVVVGLVVLDPLLVTPLVTPLGDVYYRLGADALAKVTDGDGSVTVPASEIIHDRMNCLWHPLVGVSPLYAAAAAAGIGLTIQDNSAQFFGNASQPGGVLVAPGAISQENARELKDYWNTNYTGDNAGKIAVLGDGLKYEQIRMKATDAQLIEQLRWSDTRVCTAFGMPAYKVNVGDMPAYNNIEALERKYYSDCLQIRIEEMEACLDEGLGLDGYTIGVELDLSNLLRMDSKTQMETLKAGVEAGVLAPNEGRKQVNLKPLKGGDTVYLQQQQYSLAALAERDSDKPFSKAASGASGATAPTAVQPDEAEEPVAPSADDEVRQFLEAVQKGLACAPN